ncbi:MAG: hypothetical protein MJ245_05820 [Clostridia bacterium]|nr:hypothetical protein [Clostridia bacterium]
MKNKNLGDAFTYGTNFLSDDNVDFEDKVKIRASLEKCATAMLEVIHKYEGTKCYTCVYRNCSPFEVACKYQKECFESAKYDHYKGEGD